MTPTTSLHNFTLQRLEGQPLDFSTFKGKKVLLVNVASACGYTPQYRQLQELYEAHADKLVVVGLPCNDFGGQEPGSSTEIREFCQVRYGVTFPLTEKVKIKGTPHPLYAWLTQAALNGVADHNVTWNFCKFLIDEAGQLMHFYPSSVSPIDPAILDQL